MCVLFGTRPKIVPILFQSCVRAAPQTHMHPNPIHVRLRASPPFGFAHRSFRCAPSELEQRHIDYNHQHGSCQPEVYFLFSVRQFAFFRSSSWHSAADNRRLVSRRVCAARSPNDGGKRNDMCKKYASRTSYDDFLAHAIKTPFRFCLAAAGRKRCIAVAVTGAHRRHPIDTKKNTNIRRRAT